MKKQNIRFFGKLAVVLFLTSHLLISCDNKNKKQENDTQTAKDTVQTEVNQFGGLALYTVRDAMAEDAKETLKTVAEDGYLNIEAAGYNEGKFYGMSPSEFASYLKEVNLKPVSTHQSSVTLENADTLIADAKAAGFE